MSDTDPGSKGKARRDGLYRWQQEFKQQPVVWYVMDPEGCPGSFYDSREAAQYEVDWERSRGRRGYTIVCSHIHNIDLSRRRWADGYCEKVLPEAEIAAAMEEQ